jgi:8-oxo-dGTP pyrophosphatase MutT (NUDIX family)
MFKGFIDELSRRMRFPLPGRDVQYQMAPVERKLMEQFIPEDVVPKVGAVLILLYPWQDKIYTVFMKRPPYDGTHGGQVSFPGGKWESDDPSLEFTALRESREEIGIVPDDIQIIGKLTELYIPPSNFHVHPFLGVCQSKPNFIIDPKEVDIIIEVPVEDFFKEDVIQTYRRQNAILGREVETPYYHIAGERIWGATAMLMAELTEIIRPILPK